MTPEQKLAAIINLVTNEVRDAFLLAVQSISDGVQINELIAAIETGDYERVFVLLNMNTPAFRPLTRALEKAFESFGDSKGDTFPARLKTPVGSFVFRFDIRNERAEKWLKEQSSELIASVQDDARSAIRNAMARGLENGANPRTTALDLVGRIDRSTGNRVGGVIGLTKNQEFWVESARRRLVMLDSKYFSLSLRDKRFDKIVSDAIASGKPLDAETIDKLVMRYKMSALRHRGENIARTETIRSLNAADDEATRQAVASGAIRESAVKREWDSAGDNRVRPSHKLMDGQQVGLNEPFTSPKGDKLMYPGDASLGASADEIVDCRCRVKTIIDWFDGVE